MASTSPPAQKPLSPFPLIKTRLTADDDSALSRASCIRRIISTFRLLIALERLSVMLSILLFRLVITGLSSMNPASFLYPISPRTQPSKKPYAIVRGYLNWAPQALLLISSLSYDKKRQRG